MLTGKKLVIVANLETNQSSDTGNRYKRVTNARRLVATVELVGIQTVQVGQAQGFNLSFSVEVPRIQYDGEKYLYFNGRVYEVKTLSKAKEPTRMLLNVQALDDIKAKTAIERWIDE